MNDISHLRVNTQYTGLWTSAGFKSAAGGDERVDLTFCYWLLLSFVLRVRGGGGGNS